MHEHRIAARLQPFAESVFTGVTRLAAEHSAINLGQGFPDDPPPPELLDAASRAIRDGNQQYARPFGEPKLVEAIADWHEPGLSRGIDPMNEITVTSGCTEALCAAMLGLIEPGDEIVTFDPVYDAYPACATLAGATLRRVPLRPPADQDGDFWFDADKLRAAFTARTKAVIVNTPHNPTGKVFTRNELELIAELAKRHNALVLSDEVYERLVYQPAEHVSVASLDGMFDRTLTLSSLGKTLCVTGWKIGWAVGPASLLAGLRAAHQYTVFCSATPLQHAAAKVLAHGGTLIAPYLDELRTRYAGRRDLLLAGLRGAGFTAYKPASSYFVLTDHSHLGLGTGDDVVRRLIEDHGVATIPAAAFYGDPSDGDHLLRIAFCKQRSTIEAAVERLSQVGRASPTV